MSTDYTSRLKILTERCDDTLLFTSKMTSFMKGYTRVVIGQRGSYIEFNESHFIESDKLYIPEGKQNRPIDGWFYYIELRHKDAPSIKVYLQKRTVDYADYRIGCYYVSPFELKLINGESVIDPLRKRSNQGVIHVQ